MDANRDEAIKCVDIAKKYVRLGNSEAAKRFLRKAVRLDPDVKLPSIDNLSKGDTTGHRSRNHSSSHVSPSRVNAREKSEEKNFLKADVEAVRHVLKCSDLYQILGVNKDALEDDIRRAYKSLARKFHPDKNRTPGATEAFKKIGNAFNVLVDSEKRRRYDQFGNADDPPPVIRQRRHDVFYQFDGQGFDADVFNMFFNGGFPFVYRNHRGPNRQQRESERESTYLAYIQILPLLVLFGLSFFSNLFVRDPYFSLSLTSKYPVERITNYRHIPYYVKTTFADDFDGSIRQLESQIEEQYMYYLRERCFKERSQKESAIHRARFMRDNEALHRANQLSTHNCDRVIELFG